MKTLALLGGKKVRSKPFPPHPIIGKEERQAVKRVIDEGVLSGFIGAPGSHFTGGKYVKLFEENFSRWNNSRYAVAVNSATAGLHSALIALGVGVGDEVIVPPVTFSATVATVLMCGAIPIFADLSAENFCLDPKSIAKRISKKTKAIVVVHLFGRPAPMKEILRIARQYKLKVLEDAAQSLGAEYHGVRTGNLGDIGVFSFTASKQITTLGEGGMIVTKDKRYMKRCQMVRNHGEVMGTVESKETMRGILGWNYRLTEAAAAFGNAQLDKFDRLLSIRRNLATYLTDNLRTFSFLSFPKLEEGVTHSYYILAMLYDKKRLGIHRNTIVQALQAEGIPVAGGYVEPLYLNPVYIWKVFNNVGHFPFSSTQVKDNIYKKGLCPMAEELYNEQLIITLIARPYATESDMDDVIAAFKKVSAHRDELKKWEKDQIKA